jgi:8-oxo-dGTP pyrophosphatase MutT (NUDIX family)
MVWTPRVTVAAIVERDNKYLIVEETIEGELKINQPAGHWEPGETLQQAVIRESLEETAWEVEPQSLVGIYHWDHPQSGDTYLRFAFHCHTVSHNPQLELDEGIERAVWLTHAEIEQRRHQWRSPQILECVIDYEQGKRVTLDLIRHVV